MSGASRVVLGLGGCVDHELTLSADVLEQLVTEYGIRAAELASPPPVADERDLVVSILGYVARAGGGEHFVASAPALATFAGRFPHRTTLGGTSVRAGLLMSRLGVPSTFHLVSIDDTVRRLLPPDVEYICSGGTDTFDPHLIVQYDRGLRIRAGDVDITAAFPNRLIYVNDPANESMLLADGLGARLRAAEIFLISGFNAMRDKDLLDDRLRSLRSHMLQLPPGAVTYFEDAAYHEPSFSRRVREVLLDAIDVYGMNEDELQSYLGHPVDLLSARDVAAALGEVQALIPVPTLVLHTKYWALAAGARAAEFTVALDTGTVLAATRYSYGDDFTDADVDRLRRQPRRPESVAFAAALRDRLGDGVRCVPGFALDVAHPTTVGLGDTFVGGLLAALVRKDRRLSGDGRPRNEAGVGWRKTVETLPANQPETFYRGAGRIAAFRNVPASIDRPEDWVGSVTSRFALAPSGLSTLSDGRVLAEAIAADPRWWLGPERADSADTGVLVKLLDAGQRLPLHVHPDRRFARAHLASPYGKAEAWVIVSARPDAHVHLGFARDVASDELAGWVAGQQVEQMLAATNRIPVAAGDAIFCPAGLPHAIGDGILLVEVQEPTDFSVLLEYAGFGLADGHLGLGYDMALQCVDRGGWTPDRIDDLRGGADRLLPASADEFFTARRLRGGDRLEQGFCVLVVVAGEGRLTGEMDDLAVRRGDTLLIPHAAGPLHVDGRLEMIRLSASGR